MNKTKSVLLTDNEFLFTVIGIIGISILYIPSTAIAVAKQDGWIATILGSIYPLYVIIIASIIIKKNPDTSIMSLSKKYLGPVFGNLLNFLFMAQFLYYAVMVTSAGANLLILYAVSFMSPLKVVILLSLLVVYGSYKGLKVLARINVIAFFALSLIMASTLISFTVGDFLNMQPVFETEFGKLAKASVDTSFSYSNMEMILVIHPFVKNKHKIIKLAFIGTIIITVFYTLSVFTATFFLGPDIAPKSFWPLTFVTEGVKIPLINNFRFILMIIWPLIAYRTIATEYFMSASIMDSITGIDKKKWCLFLAPFLLFLPVLFKNEIARRDFGALVTPYVTIFNLVYITLIALIVLGKNKKSVGKQFKSEE